MAGMSEEKDAFGGQGLRSVCPPCSEPAQISEDWNLVYDHVRSHQGLGHLIPVEFLNGWMEGCEDGDEALTV